MELNSNQDKNFQFKIIMIISYSAPAKVILSGEHSVVYGKPAVATAIDLRLQFAISSKSFWQSRQRRERPESHRIGESGQARVTQIAKIVTDYLKKQNPSASLRINNQYSYQIKSDIPIGRGLGSSGALCVSACAAFYDYYSGKKISEKELNILAHNAEKVFHKNPSGIDTTVSVLGGLLFYRKEFEFLKSIFQLPYLIPPEIESNTILIDSGKPIESTADMIAIVKNNYSTNPKKFQKLFNEIENVTKQLTIAIVSRNIDLFVKSIKTNQDLLIKIGVVSGKANKILSELQQWGYGKITGAGGIKNGSGYLLFYAKDKHAAIDYCQKNNLDYLIFKQSSHGCQKC